MNGGNATARARGLSLPQKRERYREASEDSIALGGLNTALLKKLARGDESHERPGRRLHALLAS